MPTPLPWDPYPPNERVPPMPNVATSPAELMTTIGGAAHIDGDQLVIDDEPVFRDTAIRDLAWTAAFADDDATREAAQWIVWEASQALGARSASIHELYLARGRGEVSGFTVPAINLRAQTFDMARTVFEPHRARRSARSSSRSPAASRPIPSSDRSTTRRPSSPRRSRRTGEHRYSSRATTTSSMPRSTRPTPNR